MKIFLSYTSKDRDWAYWIGWHLDEAGHSTFVHEWEVGAGENIARIMEERLQNADRLIGVFSDAYCDALYSQSERWAAYWNDPSGRRGFLVPIEVAKVSNWPAFVSPLKRLSLLDLEESEAASKLIEFLIPPEPPKKRPIFPPASVSERPNADEAREGRRVGASFVKGGESLGSTPPSFPAARSKAEEDFQGPKRSTKKIRDWPEPGPIRNPDDPQKRRWGGRATLNGRKLSAVRTETTPKHFWVDLIVESVDGSNLQGPVVFHLHDSFAQSVRAIRTVRNNKWTTYKEIYCDHTFTVGVQVKDREGRWIGLEYDLARLAKLPKRFRFKP